MQSLRARPCWRMRCQCSSSGSEPARFASTCSSDTQHNQATCIFGNMHPAQSACGFSPQPAASTAIFWLSA